MDATYNQKLTLHIPHLAFTGGKLEEIDHEALKRRIFLHLRIYGVESWYTTPSTGYYKERVYPQDLLTVFCDDIAKDTIVDIFRRSFLETQLQQEAFAYECNGTLVVVPLRHAT